jgi:hypothetical protein
MSTWTLHKIVELNMHGLAFKELLNDKNVSSFIKIIIAASLTKLKKVFK